MIDGLDTGSVWEGLTVLSGRRRQRWQSQEACITETDRHIEFHSLLVDMGILAIKSGVDD